MSSSRGSTASVDGVIIGNVDTFGGHGLDETDGRGKGKDKGRTSGKGKDKGTTSRTSSGSGKSGKGKGEGSKPPVTSDHSGGSVDGVLLEPQKRPSAMEKATVQLPPTAPIQVEPSAVMPDSEVTKTSTSWVEYENVLTNCEKWVCDRVEACARCCLCCRCSDPDKHADGTVKPKKFKNWEGMDENVPERYQRWEGIRERNVITSVIFSWCGKGRKQPTKIERLHLFILYASVWYLAYGLSLRRRSAPCRKAWAETCVPVNLGGKCNSDCASEFILDETPEMYSTFEDVIGSTQVGLDIYKAKCIGTSSVRSPCDVNLCADAGERTCFDKPDGTTDKQCHPACSVVIWSSVIVLYLIIFTLGVVIIATYMGGADGVLYETMWWFASFLVLCVLEVAKAFIFGFIVGTYIISSCFGSIAGALWKFALA